MSAIRGRPLTAEETVGDDHSRGDTVDPDVPPPGFMSGAAGEANDCMLALLINIPFVVQFTD